MNSLPESCAPVSQVLLLRRKERSENFALGTFAEHTSLASWQEARAATRSSSAASYHTCVSAAGHERAFAKRKSFKLNERFTVAFDSASAAASRHTSRQRTTRRAEQQAVLLSHQTGLLLPQSRHTKRLVSLSSRRRTRPNLVHDLQHLFRRELWRRCWACRGRTGKGFVPATAPLPPTEPLFSSAVGQRS